MFDQTQNPAPPVNFSSFSTPFDNRMSRSEHFEEEEEEDGDDNVYDDDDGDDTEPENKA